MGVGSTVGEAGGGRWSRAPAVPVFAVLGIAGMAAVLPLSGEPDVGPASVPPTEVVTVDTAALAGGVPIVRAMFSASDITPGYSETRVTRVVNQGLTGVDLALWAQVTGPLAEHLDIRVIDESSLGGERLLFEGSLEELGNADGVGPWQVQPGDEHRFRFEVFLPADTGNDAQGLEALATFTVTSADP